MNVTKATLIVTLLYNPKAETETYLANSDIYDKLIKHLARSKEEGGLGLSEVAHQRYWSNREASIFVAPFALNELKHLELEDIALVQVGINIHNEAVAGWSKAEERLAEAMNGQPRIVEKAFVGRTLVYAASTPPDADGEALSEALLNKLRLEDKEKHLPHKALAACALTGGKLWLLKSGASGESNIYMALEREAEENPFKTTMLFGYQARLIYPDVIAHKAYYMARDYTIGYTREEFRQASEKLMKKTIEILAQTEPSNPPSDQPSSGATHSDQTGELNSLSKQAAALTTVSAKLRQLHSRLKIHQFNYQLGLNRETPLGDIASYHQQQQKNILFRLKEDLTDANATLDATNTALNYLRADYERQQAEETKQLRRDEERHAAQKAKVDQRTQDIGVGIGIALSVAQILTSLPIASQALITLCSGVIIFFFLEWWRR